MVNGLPGEDRRFARAVVWFTFAASFVYLASYTWFRMWPLDAFLSVRVGWPNWAGHDFIAFLGAARLIDAGAMVDTYDLTLIKAAYQTVLGDRGPAIPWPYPPVTALFIQPLAWVSSVTALAIFFGVLTAAVVVLVRLVSGRWTIAFLALGLPSVVVALMSGQNGTFTALLLGLGLIYWQRLPWAAGIALGMLAYKPQFVLLPALMALVLGNRQVLFAMIATGMVLVLVSIALYGIDPWLAWPQAASRQIRYFDADMVPLARVVTVYALVHHWFGSAGLGLAIHALVAAPAVLVICAVWRGTDDLFLRAVTLAVGSVFVSPYAFDYDLAVLAIPLGVLLGAAPRDLALPLREFRWFALLAIGPQAVNALAISAKWQLAVFLLAGALIAAAYQAGFRLNLLARAAAA
jgi:Glycosyltransferase family 87